MQNFCLLFQIGITSLFLFPIVRNCMPKANINSTKIIFIKFKFKQNYVKDSETRKSRSLVSGNHDYTYYTYDAYSSKLL